MIKILVFISLLSLGLGEFQSRKAKTQVIWKAIDTPTTQSSPMNWETTISDSEKPDEHPAKWETVYEAEGQNQHPSKVVWEVLQSENETFIPPPQTKSNSVVTPPTNLEEAETLLGNIPLKPSDYQPVLRLSPLVSTAETLPMEQWRIAVGMISHFGHDRGTDTQNYLVNMDIGFNDNLLLSLFVGQTGDPLNTPLDGFTTQSGNFWRSYGAAARWQVINQNN